MSSTLASLIFFFLMIRRPPRSTLFPTRRSSDLAAARARAALAAPALRGGRAPGRTGALRSEEHTSELQSRFDLVCRLLLEKKKKKRLGRSTCTREYGSFRAHSRWINQGRR